MKRNLITGVFIVFLLLAGFLLWMLDYPSQLEYVTVSEVWKNPKLYDGKIIRVRGRARFYQSVLLDMCYIRSCNCNDEEGVLDLIGDTPPQIHNRYSFTEDDIHIIDIDCKGSHCSITCSPFQPEPWIEYELVGRLAVTYRNDKPAWMNLTNINLRFSRQLVNGEWERIPIGIFVWVYPYILIEPGALVK
jgi:hypothetical protein